MNNANVRYSPVGPLILLQDLQEKEVLGDYLLLLAHDVVEQPGEFAALADSVPRANSYIIMDNSTVELGSAVDIDTLNKAAEIVMADCIIPPDIIGDSKGTQALWEEHKEVLLKTPADIMKVVQGNTVEEVTECINWWLGQKSDISGSSSSSVWGLPRALTNNHNIGTRVLIAQYIHMFDTDCKIHLLGMSNYLSDDILACQQKGVVGIDSANPLVLGQANFEIDPEARNPVPHKERGNYWTSTQATEATIKNIATIRSFISNSNSNNNNNK